MSNTTATALTLYSHQLTIIEIKYSCKLNITQNCTHTAKIDLNGKWLPKQKTIQNLNIDAQEFRKTRNENPLAQDRSAGTG